MADDGEAVGHYLESALQVTRTVPLPSTRCQNHGPVCPNIESTLTHRIPVDRAGPMPVSTATVSTALIAVPGVASARLIFLTCRRGGPVNNWRWSLRAFNPSPAIGSFADIAAS